jgi:hypothetical protein
MPLKVINRYGFLIFFLKKLQGFEPLHSKMNPFSCLFRTQFVWAQTAIFLPNRALKTPESQQLLIVSRIFPNHAIQTKIVQPLGGFFQQ